MHCMLLFWFADFGGSLEPNPNHDWEMQILRYYNYSAPVSEDATGDGNVVV